MKLQIFKFYSILDFFDLILSREEFFMELLTQK